MKKVAGIILTFLGMILFLLSVLVIVFQIQEWLQFGFYSSELKAFNVFVILMLLSAMICIFGVKLIRKAGKAYNTEIPFNQELQSKAIKQDKLRKHQDNNPRDSKFYQSTVKLLSAEFVKKFILTSIFCGLALFMVFKELQLPFLPEYGHMNTWLICSLIPAATLSAIWAFFWCNIRIEICIEGLRFYRGNHKYADYPLSSNLWAETEKKYWNNIFTGTNRMIFIPVRPHYNKILYCYGISKMDFSYLVEDINKLRKDGTFDKVEQRTTVENIYETSQKAVFHLPKSTLLQQERNRVMQIGVSCTAIGAGLAGLWFIFVNGQPLNSTSIKLMLTIFLFYGMVGTIPQIIRYIGFSKKVPERIVMTNSSLRVDENSYSIKEIKGITMTPANYFRTNNNTSFRRRILIQLATGQLEYQLGSTVGAPKNLIYSDYEELMQAVRSWCTEHEIPFRENRE